MKTRDPFRHIIGTCAAQVGAITMPILSPLIIGGLIVGLELGELESGSLITVELLVMGLTSIVLAPLMARISHHKLAIAAALVLVGAHSMSAAAEDLHTLYTWRILAGLAGGCLTATVNAAIARARAPALLYGLAWATGYCVSAILAVTITETSTLVSYDVVYRWLAIAILLVTPFLYFVPRHGRSVKLDGFPAGSVFAGILLLVAIVIIGISMMAYYAFLERLAVNIEASAVQTGRIIAAAQLAGICGGLLAAPVATHFGLIRALVAITLVHALLIVIAVITSSVLMLGILAFCEAVLFIIMMPLMLTLAAHIDRQGRWAAAAGGAFIISTAFGPFVGGMLIERIGYNAIAWIQFVAAVPACLLFVRVARINKSGDEYGPTETGSLTS